jgi:hypothetical protein
MADISTFNYQRMDTTSREALLSAIRSSAYVGSGRGGYSSSLQGFLTKHDRYGTVPIQPNMEKTGLVFFTRPRLNFTTTSIRQDRTLAMLDDIDALSWMFSIRANLDTVWSRSAAIRQFAAASPYFNDESPFNVPLSNSIESIGGFPDVTAEYKTTDPGLFGEDMTMVRGGDLGRRTYNLSCQFRDIQNGYVINMLYYWILAMILQMEGRIVPYPEDRELNRLNYTCSIYRFTLDATQRRITGWAKATGCYPTSVPLGDKFNYGPGESFVHSGQKFTCNFVANHIAYMDPIHLRMFNHLVERYAGSNLTETRTKVEHGAEYNMMGVPYIDLFGGTNFLDFYARKEEISLVPKASDIESATQALRNAVSSSTSSSASNSIGL